MTEWFEQWFGEEYLHLYPHRDDEDAVRAISLVATLAPLGGTRVLDLACGSGRHAAHLAANGAMVVGFDLSMPLLSRAKHRDSPTQNLVRGDMRLLPFRDASFDLVLNLFTSFGYFADDRQHLAVIAGAAQTLVPRGKFILDYLNANLIRTALVPLEERNAGSRRFVIKRRLIEDGRYVVKEIHLTDDGRSFVERVRLFSVDELTTMIEHAGLTVTQRFGDYDGKPLAAGTPRVILVAERQ